MMPWDPPPNSRRRQALHTPSATSAAMKIRKLSRSLLRRFMPFHFPLKSARWLPRGALARITPFQRHDLHRRVAHFVQEAVDDRASQQDVPARTRRLAENDMRDAFAPGEIN